MNTHFPNLKDKIFSDRSLYFWYGSALFWLVDLTGTALLTPGLIVSMETMLHLVLAEMCGFLMTIPLRYLYKYKSAHRFRLPVLIPIVLICSAVTAAPLVLGIASLKYIILGPPFFFESQFYLPQFWFSSFTVILWSSLYLGYKIWEEWNDQKLQLEREHALLRTSELEMLKYQLNPHFLFNTLSSLRGLITADPPKAREVVTHISEFLRYSLLEGKNNEVQLIKEIQIIKLYLAIEQVRFEDDIIAEYDISPESHDYAIPIFLIHPLVENAIKHGMQTSPLPLTISVQTSVSDSVLSIAVQNTGRWIEREESADKKGIGLQNIQRRLEHAFPNKHSFDIIKSPDSVKVIVKIDCKSSN